MAERSFSGEELALIIRRAARLHAMEPEDGYTLGEVQQIATQVGLPADLVADVAESIETAESEGATVRKLLGPTGRFVCVRIISRSVSSAEYPGLLALLRSQLKVAGTAEQIGPEFEWRYEASESQRVGGMTVSVTPHSTGTKIKVETDIRFLRTGLYVAALFGGAVAGLIGSVEAGAGAYLAAVTSTAASVLGWGATRALWPRVARAASNRTERLFHAIIGHVAQPGSTEAGSHD